MTNKHNTVLYTGVTNNLLRRMEEHKTKVNRGFTQRYNIYKLVFFEEFDSIEDAIECEKLLKAGPRRKKIALIERMNPGWRDLAADE